MTIPTGSDGEAGRVEVIQPVPEGPYLNFVYHVSVPDPDDLFVGPLCAANAQNPQTFADVPFGTQFFPEIEWLAQRGVSTGWDEGASRTFRPLETVKRDAMAAFLYRLAGSPQYTAPTASPFTDVRVEDQFYKEISWLADMKISTGWDDGTFRPLQPVNRDAMAAFLFRWVALEYTPETWYKVAELAGVHPSDWDERAALNSWGQFDDVPTGTQFHKEIVWLARHRVSDGWSDGTSRTFRPVQAVNRDAMAAFMHRVSG